jgi:hypothetical protein
LPVKFTANGMVGTTNHSSKLQFQVANRGFTLNGGRTVIINGNSLLVGSVQCDRPCPAQQPPESRA